MPVRVTLVNPCFQPRIRRIAQTTLGPPLGLACLAASVRAAGHPVRIVDANALGLGAEEAAAEALRDDPRVVGLTATTPTIHLAAAIAAAIKARRPGVLTVVGGPHTTFLGARTLAEFPAVDGAARGEGERSLPALLDALEREPAEPWPRPIPGFVWRAPGGGVVDGGPAPVIDDLDALPPPARDLLPMDRYRCVDSGAFSTVLAMRGCPCACVYCAVPEMFGRRMRYRSPAAVAAEMADTHRRFGTTFFSFVDDTFTTDPAWVRAFCDRLDAEGLPGRVRWICLTRADMVDRPLLERMRRAGCVRVEMGIESASLAGRRFLRKGLSEEAIVAGYRAAREAGLSTMGFVILNIPGETEEDVARTAALVRRVDPDFLQVSFLTPYPGTTLRAEAEQRGWIGTDDWSRYSFLRGIVLRNEAFPPDRLEAMYRRFVRDFYLRPATVWKLGRLVLNGTTRLGPLSRTVALGLWAAVAGGGAAGGPEGDA